MRLQGGERDADEQDRVARDQRPGQGLFVLDPAAAATDVAMATQQVDDHRAGDQHQQGTGEPGAAVGPRDERHTGHEFEYREHACCRPHGRSGEQGVTAERGTEGVEVAQLLQRGDEEHERKDRACAVDEDEVGGHGAQCSSSRPANSPMGALRETGFNSGWVS